MSEKAIRSFSGWAVLSLLFLGLFCLFMACFLSRVEFVRRLFAARVSIPHNQ